MNKRYERRAILEEKRVEMSCIVNLTKIENAKKKLFSDKINKCKEA